MDSKTKLYQKMFTVMQNVDHIAKDIDITYSGSKGYKAISESTVTRTIRKEFLDNKLMVFPVEQEIEKTNGFTQTNTKYKIIDVETGESEILVSSGQGADTQDKGAGKAMTYSYKYMLLRTFMIPTGEDPDNVGNAEFDNKEKPKPKTELVKPKPVVITQIAVYDLDPETYKLTGGKHIGVRMIDCPTTYIEWQIKTAKESKFKTTFEKIPMDIWIEFLEVCLQIHKANKELKAKPVTDKDLEPEIIESEFANIEDAATDEMEDLLLETFPGTVESAKSKADKHVQEVLK